MGLWAFFFRLLIQSAGQTIFLVFLSLSMLQFEEKLAQSDVEHRFTCVSFSVLALGLDIYFFPFYEG
jgi:hypothetical protein